MSILDAVKREIAELPDEAQSSSLAMTALDLAERLDGAGNRDAAALSRELRSTLAELVASAPAKPKGMDPLDEIAAARAKRLSGGDVPERAEGEPVKRSGRGGAGGKRRSAAGRRSG